MFSLNAPSRYTPDQLVISLIKGESWREPGFVDALSKARLDWNLVLDQARREGVFYPLYQNLLCLGLNKLLIPDELTERFRQTYYSHISQSTDFFCRIERVLNYLEFSQIKTLLFKGPATDYFIYDNFFRPRLDLDIAVKNEQLAALEKVLLDLEYAPPDNCSDYPLPEYLNSRLFTPGSSDFLPVHIHKHLINNMFLTVDNALSLDMDKVWAQTECFKNYHYICVLKPELNIIYLCEHGLKHDFDQIVFLYEIEALIRYYQGCLDWKKLVVLAEDSGLGRVVYYGLYFVKEVLSADVPQDVIAELKPKKFTVWEKVFIKNILNKKPGRYSSYPVYLALRNGLFKKANFIFRTIFPPGFTLKGYLIRMVRLILA